MVANWVKVLWILIGGTVAAAGAAYVGGVFEKPAPGSAPVEAAVQQKPAGQTGTAKEPAGEEATASEAVADDEQQVASLPAEDSQPADTGSASEAAAAAVEPEVKVPAFDLVRVEPDGSVVIAGSAAPNSVVELIAGATVIGTATAGDTGDFAVVLDEPLKAGDYTVVLRATGSDNVVASSTQTAVIAVPESEDGQVLALVEEPGEPSRLITVPAAPKAEKPVEAEKAEMAAVEEQPAATDSSATMAAKETDDTTLAGGTQVAEAGSIETEPAAETMVAAEEEKPEATESEQQVVAVAPAEEKPAVSAPPARVAVEAVEIEGRKVFVAGRSEAGSTVRVYANDILLGQAVASDGGRFLIEAERELPVGDYIVRADMLKTGTADVVARAAVPFEREPGEKVAAIAPQEVTASGGEAVQKAEADAAEEMSEPSADVASSDTAASAPTQVASLEGKADSAEGVAAAGEGTMSASAPVAASLESNGNGNDSGTVIGNGATAPKLENVGGAVIIRRGDTLWRLSRRVYGRGVRYTTIYLANQEQISDPDRIWPGQVFSVPSETDEGEEADMSAVAEQMADPSDITEDVATR